MSDTTHEQHGPAFYVRIWAILLVLLLVSVLGPQVGLEWVTLITAFGVAIVKAYLVARNFMHINVERRYVTYLMVTCLVFMVLLFAGVSPDVMKDEGEGWVKPAWVAGTEVPEPPVHHEGGAGEHGSGH